MLFHWPALGRDHAEDGTQLRTFRGSGSWGVSTLTKNPVTGSPLVTRFPKEADALDYARARAASTGIARDKGKTLYVLLVNKNNTWDVFYRVLRGSRGLRQRAGFPDDKRRQEQILVFRNDGELPNGKTHWVLDKGQTVDVLDPGAERDKAQASRGTKALTIFDRYGDAEG